MSGNGCPGSSWHNDVVTALEFYSEYPDRHLLLATLPSSLLPAPVARWPLTVNMGPTCFPDSGVVVPPVLGVYKLPATKRCKVMAIEVPNVSEILDLESVLGVMMRSRATVALRRSVFTDALSSVFAVDDAGESCAIKFSGFPTPVLLKLFSEAQFCLVPPGDVPYRMHLTAAVLGHCIPIVVAFTGMSTSWWRHNGPSVEQSLPFSSLIPWRELAVEVPVHVVEAGNDWIERVVESLSEADVDRKLHLVQQASRHLDWLDGDALNVTMDAISMQLHPKGTATTKECFFPEQTRPLTPSNIVQPGCRWVQSDQGVEAFLSSTFASFRQSYTRDRSGAELRFILPEASEVGWGSTQMLSEFSHWGISVLQEIGNLGRAADACDFGLTDCGVAAGSAAARDAESYDYLRANLQVEFSWLELFESLPGPGEQESPELIVMPYPVALSCSLDQCFGFEQAQSVWQQGCRCQSFVTAAEDFLSTRLSEDAGVQDEDVADIVRWRTLWLATQSAPNVPEKVFTQPLILTFGPVMPECVGHHIVVPPVVLDHRPTWGQGPRPVWFFYCGSAHKAPVRLAVIEQLQVWQDVDPGTNVALIFKEMARRPTVLEIDRGMSTSVFCPCPESDDPWQAIRFYHSIQAGCIPVVFTHRSADGDPDGSWWLPNGPHWRLSVPFPDLIDYASFVVRVPMHKVWSGAPWIDELIRSDVDTIQQALRHAALQLSYSGFALQYTLQAISDHLASPRKPRCVSPLDVWPDLRPLSYPEVVCC
mmetsp:Transcript_38292/g.85923  ORF Transcript_38292/g.85923 Transcript_38292/m.85923 type:complete len:763 (-) Transcript_38292:56-2344(-)